LAASEVGHALACPNEQSSPGEFGPFVEQALVVGQTFVVGQTLVCGWLQPARPTM
jgi:hypothetical protein